MKKSIKKLAIFEGRNVRRIWDDKKELWYFSVTDIVAILTDQVDFKKAKSYWTTLKGRLKNEGSELVTKCDQLKMQSADGKFYNTDVADTETLFRLIQSIPSKKAEPIKLWLAKVGYERMQEMSDPEKALNRGRDYWQKMGRSQKWIQQRMMGQEIRNKLTDYWKDNEVQEKEEYAILTNIIHQEWSDLTVKEHKNLKSLKRENLRDHMTDAELVFTGGRQNAPTACRGDEWRHIESDGGAVSASRKNALMPPANAPSPHCGAGIDGRPFLLHLLNYPLAKLPKQCKQREWRKTKFRRKKADALPKTRGWNWNKKPAEK